MTSKEELWGGALPTGDVEVRPGVSVTVRGMSRLELMQLGKIDDHMESERLMLSTCMVDPKMSPSDVRKWQENSLPNDIAIVSEKIRDLSGIKPSADREAAKSVRS